MKTEGKCSALNFFLQGTILVVVGMQDDDLTNFLFICGIYLGMLANPGLSRRLDSSSEISPTIDLREHFRANYARFIPV